jgi:hypothetical protein
VGKQKKIIALTTGYEVDLSKRNGLQHLCQAIFMETLQSLEGNKVPKKRVWGFVFEGCLQEIHFVAGQLRVMGSPLTPKGLLEEFCVFWDEFGKKQKK